MFGLTSVIFVSSFPPLKQIHHHSESIVLCLPFGITSQINSVGLPIIAKQYPLSANAQNQLPHVRAPNPSFKRTRLRRAA
jgi:hypothetical protein